MQPINNALPPQQQGMLMQGEWAYHFAYVDYKGGCAGGGGGPANQWILVTNLRVVYEANVRNADGGVVRFERSSGSIPVAKISFVGTTSTPGQGCGCAPAPVHVLKVNSGGGHIEIAVPNRQEVQRLQQVIEWLISYNHTGQ